MHFANQIERMSETLGGGTNGRADTFTGGVDKMVYSCRPSPTRQDCPTVIIYYLGYSVDTLASYGSDIINQIIDRPTTDEITHQTPSGFVE